MKKVDPQLIMLCIFIVVILTIWYSRTILPFQLGYHPEWDINFIWVWKK